MQRYHEFQPTGFDCRGLGLPERQDWLVAPVTRNRDSDMLAESNFEVANQRFDELDPAGDNHETHRFGHWANGWFELILVQPDTACATETESIENSLSDYPILSESDYSEREYTSGAHSTE